MHLYVLLLLSRKTRTKLLDLSSSSRLLVDLKLGLLLILLLDLHVTQIFGLLTLRVVILLSSGLLDDRKLLSCGFQHCEAYQIR